jgi:hypothetical protein
MAPCRTTVRGLIIIHCSLLSYDDSVKQTILDYSVEIVPLDDKDTVYVWNSIGNWSVSGFELRLKRNILKYLINYYLPSGLFVIVSWVRIHSIILSHTVSHIAILLQRPVYCFWRADFHGQGATLVPPDNLIYSLPTISP